jgi:hypothetical protein
MYVAVDCMCGKGSLEARLSNAGLALHTLREDDLEGDLGERLRYVLGWTKHNLAGDSVKRTPDDGEHKELVEKMLHILLETHALQAS